MKNAEFVELVRSLEEGSVRDPALFRRAALRWAIAGYAFVAGVLVLIASFLVGGVWLLTTRPTAAGWVVKLMLAGGALGLAVVRALWIRFEPPEGVPLLPEQGAELHREISGLRREVQTPAIHEILITSELNASLAQTPRIGPLGPYKNTLSVGLPLLDALTPDEIRAVLAHEMGHASRAHGRSGAWVYRLRTTFARLHEHFKTNQGFFAGPFQKFFEWWWPRFSARAMVLGRIHEFEADVLAGRHESGAALIRALCRLRLAGAYLETEFWPSIRTLNRAGSEKPADMLERLRAGLVRSPFDAATLDRAWSEETSVDDTHPSLSERARALGVSRAALGPFEKPSKTGSDFYLGSDRVALSETLSQRWQAVMSPIWEMAYRQSASQRQRIEELDLADARNPLGVDATIERALLAEELEDAPAALAWFDRALAREPGNPVALFHAGRLRLDGGDDAGLDALRRAAEASDSLRGAALTLLGGHLKQRGQVSEAAAIERQIWDHGDVLAAAEKERETLTANDDFESHGLEDEGLRCWLDLLSAHPEIQAAYLRRKRLQFLRDDPRFVLAVRVKVPWYRRTEPISNRIMQALIKEFPAAGWVVILNSSDKSFRAKLEAAADRIS